jgi:hypothetical protein
MLKYVSSIVLTSLLLSLAPLSYATSPYDVNTTPATSNANICDPSSSSGTSTDMSITTNANANSVMDDLCSSSNAGYNNFSTMASNAKSQAEENGGSRASSLALNYQ